MVPKKILFATDLSCRCDRALDRSVALAEEWSAHVVAVHALEAPLSVIDAPSWRRPVHPRERAERHIRADVRGATIALEVVVERGDAVTLIIETAERLACDLIVTGVARDETLGRAILGKTVDEVIRRAKAPVLIVKSRPRGPYRRVVVATDFSDSSRRALETTLAMMPDANVSVCHAFEIPYESYLHDTTDAREQFGREAHRNCEAFLASVPAATGRSIAILCEYGSPAEVLRELAEALDVDLVVAGTQGRSRAATLLLGSVAQSLLGSVPIDVMIVPRG